VLTPEIAVPPAASENPLQEISPKAPGLHFLTSLRWPKVLATAAATAVLLFLFTWWQWQRGWRELELEAQGRSMESKIPRMTLPPGVMEPLLIHRVDPELPEGSKKAGAVLVRVVIGRDGSVIDQQPISGPSAMQRAAMDSVRYWRFQPYRVEGAPVEVETTLAVEFQEQPADAR
jgi:TonB family protein